jgi:hypothetical protein
LGLTTTCSRRPRGSAAATDGSSSRVRSGNKSRPVDRSTWTREGAVIASARPRRPPDVRPVEH